MANKKLNTLRRLAFAADEMKTFARTKCHAAKVDYKNSLIEGDAKGDAERLADWDAWILIADKATSDHKACVQAVMDAEKPRSFGLTTRPAINHPSEEKES